MIRRSMITFSGLIATGYAIGTAALLGGTGLLLAAYGPDDDRLQSAGIAVFVLAWAVLVSSAMCDIVRRRSDRH